MVAKDSCNRSTKICNDQPVGGEQNCLLYNKMSVNEVRSNENQLNSNLSNKNRKEDNPEALIRYILNDICDNAIDIVDPITIMKRGSNLSLEEKQQRTHNRRVSIVDDDLSGDFVECRNNLVNLHRRAVSESVIDRRYVVDENDNKMELKKLPDKEKKKKKISFNSLFGKKDKKFRENKEEEEKRDNLPQLPVFKSNTLGKTKKYASALELNQHNQQKSVMHRTPSFIRKLVNITEDPTGYFKRSLSFRDVSKKLVKVPSREKLTDKKNQEWRQSLQSLVETDISVSYNDLSFINYDALNDIRYEPVNLQAGRNDSKGYIARTQSMIEKTSPNLRRPAYFRLSSAYENNRLSATSFSSPSPAVSLPSLHHWNNDADSISGSNSSVHRYRRRPQSINSDEGSIIGGSSSRPSSYTTGSFRSAGSGCAKLKRHNACRQKVRDPQLLVENRISGSDNERTSRSRSLNHLDNLEMRQGIVSSADVALKDSRSEPDCTKPLLAPSVVHEPSTPTTTTPPTRKHMLSRSQKSSSECFSVNFEVGDESTWENELFFPAQRGISLFDSLVKLCELRNIDLSACDARLQDKENNCENFILFSQDTAGLVGRHVRITAKDTSNKKLSGSIHSNHSKKQSGGNRSRTTSFFNSSTEDATVASSTLSLHDGDQSRRQIKQRLTAFFGNVKDTKYEALIDQLDKYSKQGIPHVLKYPQGQCESVDALYKLEDDWREIIEYNDLNEKLQQQQTALWELIKTEVAYIKTLKVVTDLFLACLKDLQSKNLLKEIDTDKLFSNITEILDANVVFWRNTLFPLVRDMRKYKRPSCIENMLEGFHSIQDIFQPYYKYCAEQSRCQHYCRENLDSEVFTAYLTWCESQKECNRLRLMDILVQPMQRLTKYGLLLKAILKNTDEDVERENLQTMIKMVDDFVNNVNLSLKHRQDKERLKGIIARIESYDIVESKDDDIDKLLKKEKSLTQLDLTKPMLNCPVERKRHLLLEGDLKLKDSGTSKMEVHCFLLTDMLLVCKPSTRKGGATMRVIRQPYLVDRLVVSELHRETPSLAVIYKNEFDMAVAAFILQNNDAKKIKGWKEGISKAQTLYAQARQMTYTADDSIDPEYSLDYNLESDYSNIQLIPRSPLATSSRASRVSSLVHSHSGSVEMNDQSSVGSINNQSRAVSVENENRTGSLSSDEGVQSLPPDKSPVSQKNSFKNRLFHKTPNTLSVQPYGSLGQSLPNLTLGSPNVGSMNLNLNQNTLSVPSGKNGSQLLSPTHRGISYPPPSPTRGNLRRSLAISQSKNPPLVKARQVCSTSSVSGQQFDFDVPVIAGVSQQEENCEAFSRGQHRQAMKRSYRYHTAGIVDDIKKNDNRDASIHKRLSWNCTSQEQRPPNEDQT
ncbi:pleckstrin homology domain-containing family G member 5 isoform X1 [Diorhabda sublineata]|uniref:pleckstrin homology domain-containing family G member 5 isoform X1 n=1 Tax=Diorhabda sublineata TaxID=1163346 RepID=UPI0024E05CB7|nr:pleckstrin homology domain-containing family G member 5 isoform X1 [Diorhabda sublineata]XP_056648249.1 pleckstrin homology domain-containing family G member 5 isoform X1 [Diorhabda sublineata]